MKLITATQTAAERVKSWETDYAEPTIVIATPAAPSLSIYGDMPLSAWINTDKIPAEFETARFKAKWRSGVIFHDQGTRRIEIHAPVRGIKKAYIDSVVEVLAGYGVQAKQSNHRPDSNDIVFNGKKFCGMIEDPDREIFASFVTLDFNVEKIDGIFKLDTSKFQQRGNVKNIADVNGGLREANAMIGDDTVLQIIQRLAGKMGWELE